MDIMMIGKNIAELRKQKGVKQEELAKFVGVTAQAVSKWENGGVPDTELLPKVADFFEVSIDTLFGRAHNEFRNIQDAIFSDLTSVDEDKRISRAFELCWIIEQSMFGTIFSDPERFKQEAASFGKNDQVYSQMLMNSGYTEMGLFNRLQYFLIVPEAPDKERAFFKGINYPEFFKILSDKDLFDSLVMLFKRESTNSFTEKLLIKELGLSQEKATQVISDLLKTNMLIRSVAEVDDELVEFYRFWPRPSFVSLLIFAREMIDAPNNFYVNNNSRTKPYLK